MPEKDDTELEEEPEGEDTEATEQAKPTRKRSQPKPSQKSAKADEEDEEEEEILPEAVIPPSRGGSGALVAIIVLVIVALLVAGVWYQRESAREKAQADREARLAIAASQLGTIQDRIDKALRELDQSQPNVDRAIETLNDACENIGVLAQGASQIEGGSELSLKLTDMQSAIRLVTQELEGDQSQYEEAVKAAREKLKLSTTRRVRPIAAKTRNLVSTYTGDVDTPISIGTISTGEPEPEEEAQTTETKSSADSTEEGEAGPGAEAPES